MWVGLRSGQQLPVEEILRITRSVASALAYAHQHGMIHRDIKPGNVMLDGQRVILTDFGVAKMVVHENSGNFTTSGALLGTPAYMAPEHGLGQLGDLRSDLYSLGVMMYQMATNVLPFSADTPIALVLRHINDVVEPPRLRSVNLPTSLESIIMRLLEKEPSQRYQTADDLLSDLDNLDRVAPYAPATPPPITMLPKHTERMAQAALTAPTLAQAKNSRRALMAGLTVILMAGLIGGGLWIARGAAGSSPTATTAATAVVALSSQVSTEAALPPTQTPAETPAPSASDEDSAGLVPDEISETPSEVGTQVPCEFTSTRPLPIRLLNNPSPFSQALDTKILPDERVEVMGVFRDTPDQKTWWQVQIEDDQGWLPEDIGDISGSCEAIPEVTPDPSNN